MNKKQFAILSIGNILHKDEGMALYTSEYLESNYSFSPNVDIIHGGVEGMSLLNIFIQYEEILILDVIGIEDDAGALYHFPMPQFRGLGTDGSAGEMGPLECLNMLERRGDTLPEVSLLAIVPDAVEEGVGLSPALLHSFAAYLLMIEKTLENKGITSTAIAEKKTIESVVEGFKS